MTNRKKEIAKFMCCAEAFHALMHTYFWLSGKTIKAFGLKQTPALHKAGAVGHAVAAVALGIYAWGETAEANPAGALAEGKTVANVG